MDEFNNFPIFYTWFLNHKPWLQGPQNMKMDLWSVKLFLAEIASMEKLYCNVTKYVVNVYFVFAVPQTVCKSTLTKCPYVG